MNINVSYKQRLALMSGRWEPIFFHLFLFVNLIPILGSQFFPTVDGPAHLYNSKLILELIKDPQTALSSFYSFNAGINPNWSGHFLLSIFMLVFPAFVAEKIILLGYLAGLPLAMRYLFNSFAISNKTFLYLIFPFTYSFLFFYGFYNFNLGVVICLFTAGYWYKHMTGINSRKVLVFMLLSTLISLSHIFVFVIFLMLIVSFTILYLVKQNGLKNADSNYLKTLLFSQSLALLPGLILTFLYLSGSGMQDAESVYFSFEKIISLIKTISPAKGINYGRANIITQWFFYILTASFLYFMVTGIDAVFRKRKCPFSNNIWILLSLSILLLIFILPDGKKDIVGFATHRLLLFFFIFIIIWLASQKIVFWFRLLMIIIINYVNVAFVLHNQNSVASNIQVAGEVIEASSVLEPDAIVLPVVRSDNSVFSHISNYLGVFKPMIILENYEATLHYFPLKWNMDDMPKLVLGDLEENSICLEWPDTKNQKAGIDYVFLLNDCNEPVNPVCFSLLNKVLESHYELHFQKGKIQIYKRIKSRGKEFTDSGV